MKCSISILAVLTIIPNVIFASMGDGIMKAFQEQLSVKVKRFMFLQLSELHQVRADIKNGFLSPERIFGLLTIFKDKPNDLLSLEEYILENDADIADDVGNPKLQTFEAAAQKSKSYYQKLESNFGATLQAAELFDYLDALIEMGEAFDRWLNEIDINSIPGIHEKMGSILAANGIVKALSGL